MKIIVGRDALHKELSFVQSVIERKNTIPVLSNVLIEAIGAARIQIIGTDLDVTIRTEVDVDETDDIQGSLCIPARKLIELVRLMPSAPIILEKQKDDWVIVKCERAKYKLPGVSRESFPELPVFNGAAALSVSSALLHSFIERSAFAITTDESRFTLQGAKFVMNSEGVLLVTTDGHRLAYIFYAAQNGSSDKAQNGSRDKKQVIDCLIPCKALGELKKLTAAFDGEVSFGIDDNHIFFSAGPRLLSSRLLHGQFPDYEKAMPKELVHSLEFDSKDLNLAVRRAALMSNDDGTPVRFRFTKNELQVSGRSPESGEAHDVLPTRYAGAEVDIGFNAHYLQDFFNVAGDAVVMEFNDGNSQVQLRPAEACGFEYKYVVMPLRL